MAHWSAPDCAFYFAWQEYYTAIALLNTALLPSAPWKFTSRWSNVLKLGDEMGLGFRRNMLRYDCAR